MVVDDIYTLFIGAQIRSHMTTPVGGRPLSNTRAENLNQWKHFNQDFSYGQDILGIGRYKPCFLK